ncbi:cyclin-A2 [Orussus abietinus]|uniref:cyclin-A2 n=1 Tax=Orussus abietinus TaxID=222816 RepID=UPI0006254693|nr:cyclin-A2 [Orussus abietinus]
MAAVRAHEDQENRLGEPRRAKENLPAPLQQKRAVLGVLHNNLNRNSKPEICGKDEKYPKGKAFLPTQFEPFKIYEDKKEEPAFKVYEDKLEEETSVVLRESKEIVKVTVKQTTEISSKVEWKEPPAESKPVAANVLPTVRASPKEKDINEEIKESLFEGLSHSLIEESPMSLEKSTFSGSTRKDRRALRETSKALRINFFDVDEYRADIYNYLRTAETQHRPKPGYMKKQPDITYSMRSILVDWLVEVAEEYQLHSETFYLAVSYIDRFLSYMSVVRAKLQLVGTAAMFIAAKYEEIYPPDVGEFVYITDDTYSKKQVLRMEHLILRVLSFDLTVPTPLAFLTCYCISNNLSDKIQHLAMYLCELSTLEADPYLQYPPSLLAASAVALARHTLLEEAWPHELELSTGYSLQDLKECISCLNRTFANAPNIPQKAIQEKYKKNKFGHVSMLLPRSTKIMECEDDTEESA